MNITDLPVGVLTNVASFLPNPSRALFAVSLTAPSSSWQNSRGDKQLSEMSQAIMIPSSQWKILDFEEVETSLAKKLNDDDLFAVLSCIKQTVKRLKLTGCINIIGSGLTPLRESTVLRLLDLRLSKHHEDTYYFPLPMPRLSLSKQHEDTSTRLKAKICQETVIPILDNVISVNGSSLTHIKYPHEWIGTSSIRFEDFEERYMEHLVRVGIISSEYNSMRRGSRRLSREPTLLGTIPFDVYFIMIAFCFATVFITNKPVLIVTLMVMKIVYQRVIRPRLRGV